MENAPPVRSGRKANGLWSRIGGGSLLFAALLHGVLLCIGAFWILHVIREPDQKVDFLPTGGGGGERGAEHSVRKKPQSRFTPPSDAKRVFAEGAAADFSIPEQGDEFGEMSSLSSLAGGGGMSGGLGGSGSGKGFGTGAGAAGALGGGGILGIKLFGMDLDVKSIGVVLDVSRSMTPHLKRVLDEVNHVAPGSPVILHVGCGIGEGRGEKRIEPVSAPSDKFKRFWYLHQDPLYKDQQTDRKAETDFSRPLPSPRVYELLADRPKTSFYEYEGTKYTGNALLANELRNVEAVYWFADFQDKIIPEEAEKIQQALTRRKQKLFIHASVNGQYLTTARDLIAIPTGGSQLKTPKL